VEELPCRVTPDELVPLTLNPYAPGTVAAVVVTERLE
jgi:hypothetical protein